MVFVYYLPFSDELNYPQKSIEMCENKTVSVQYSMSVFQYSSPAQYFVLSQRNIPLANAQALLKGVPNFFISLIELFVCLTTTYTATYKGAYSSRLTKKYRGLLISLLESLTGSTTNMLVNSLTLEPL